MMEFAMLCSGSKGNSFVIRDGTTAVMIDCGSTRKYLFSSLNKINVAADELDAVILTHDHSDHIAQIRSFRHLPVYSPVEIDDVEVFLVRPMRKFSIETLTFTPLALSHDALNTTGYVIESGQEKLVYITDTGYVNRNYLPLLNNADYIVMESNHDVGMLMRTSRPQYLKSRIYSDQGHLCNEDCAQILGSITGDRTKMIILAHISQEANTREQALKISREYLLANCRDVLRRDLILCAAGQNEMIRKGMNDEKVDPGSVSCAVGMECGGNLFTL